MKVLDRIAVSRYNYWLGGALDLFVAIVLLVLGAPSSSPAQFVAVACLGAVAYTLFEYVMHRWPYHHFNSDVRRLHARHHKDPRATLGSPFFFSLSLTGAVYAIVAVLFGRPLAASFSGTVLLLFVSQSALHHWIHVGRDGPFTALRKRHLAHHRHGYGNFGVITGLWDHVFKTNIL
jgi:sterol desaturase/sphingolipid hydroxylase (fatty acid hydroxylase superfamily)